MSEPEAVAYAALRARITEVVRAMPPDALDAPSPATPGWRVRDVLAHMVGVTDDVVHGRLDGVASDSWTQAQVEPRTEVSVAALLDEWTALAPDFDAAIAAVPFAIAGQALFDAATHEHDIRHALTKPGARDTDAVALGWEWLVDARTRGGGRAIRFVTETGDVVAGARAPGATVRAPRFELFRATAGRRCAEEIEQYEWDPAPDVALLLAAPIFRLRTEPLGE